jgi:ubiquinone/menaquinone biosynthesis C-methylase UbiE
MTSGVPASLAFNEIAAKYDSVFSDSVIGRTQREAVWEAIDRIFLPGQSILEINCGTGVDAVHLAHRGVRVHACDASPAMIDVARARVRECRVDVSLEMRGIEQLSSLSGQYDGLFSNFGGLNCVHDLNRLICDLERRIRVGGNVVLCYMGPFCAWETAWYLLHGEPGKAVRRWKRHDVPARVGNSATFLIDYPSVRDLKFALAPEFRLREWKAVGAFVPPSYMESFAAAHPLAMKLAARLDRRLAWTPVLRAVGDHVLLRFKRIAA